MQKAGPEGPAFRCRRSYTNANSQVVRRFPGGQHRQTPYSEGQLPEICMAAAGGERWLYPTEKGLYCEPGDFYIDPSRAVSRAIITHGHSDHARPGHQAVLATP